MKKKLEEKEKIFPKLEKKIFPKLEKRKKEVKNKVFFFKKQKETSKIPDKEFWKFRGKNCPFAKKVKKVKDNKVQEIFMCYGYIEKFELDPNFEICKKCSVPEIIISNPTACKNLAALDMKGKNGTTRYYCQVLKIKDLDTKKCLPQFCNHYQLRPQDQKLI